MRGNRLAALSIIVVLSMAPMIGAAGSPGDEPARAAPPTASVLTVEMRGIVDAINDPTHLLDGSVAVGGDITVIYQISPNAAPDPYPQPNSTDYFDAIKPGALKLIVGRYSLRNRPYWIQVTMADDLVTGTGVLDGWYIWAPQSRVRGTGHREEFNIWVSLWDDTAQALNSTALVPVPSLQAWTGARLGVSRRVTTGSITIDDLFIAGAITSIRVVD